MKEKLKQSMISVSRAIVKLKIALEQNSTDELVIDGTIQRFEFCKEQLISSDPN